MSPVHRRAGVPRSPARRRPGRSAGRLPAALAEDPAGGARSTAARPGPSGFHRASTRCSSSASLRCLGPDELIFVDVTASTHWASEAIEVRGPRRYFTPADNQSMGWAIPAAIGAQLVRPDRQVVCVTGDGCFLMSAMEMSSAARAGLPVKFFVFDDGAYHYMQMLQEPVYRRTTATEIARIDYAAFARAVGLGYNQITSNADVFPASAALATPARADPRHRELRGPRDPLAQRPAVEYFNSLPNGQKVRLAARSASHRATPKADND